MTLAPGMKRGSYEILSPLGAGGMGEVYRARDTRLHRDVAIKALPPSLSNDPERLARFEREARLLAALNHPNVAAIYGRRARCPARAARPPDFREVTAPQPERRLAVVTNWLQAIGPPGASK